MQGKAIYHLRAGMAGMSEPSRGQEILSGFVEFKEIRREGREGGGEEGLVNGLGDDAVTLGVEVDAVLGEGETRIGFTAVLEVLADGGVNVYDVANLVFQAADVLGVWGDDVLVVVLVGFLPAEERGVCADKIFCSFGCFRVKGGRGDEDEFCAAGFDFFNEALDAFLVGGEALLRKGVVDAIIDAVTGNDEVWFHHSEGAWQAFI